MSTLPAVLDLAAYPAIPPIMTTCADPCDMQYKSEVVLRGRAVQVVPLLFDVMTEPPSFAAASFLSDSVEV